jgi:peroxiredoxin
MQVEGSAENTLLYDNLRYEAQYQARVQPVQQQVNTLPKDTPEFAAAEARLQSLIAERKTYLEELFASHPHAFFTKFKQAGQNPVVRTGLSDEEKVYWYRQEFWDGVDFTDERLIRTPVIANKLKRYITELTNQHPDSIIAATDYLISQLPASAMESEYYKFFTNWVALQYEPTKTTLMDPEAVFVHMVQHYFTYDKAFWSDSVEVFALQQRAGEMANSIVGKAAPDVSVPGLDGQPKTLFDLKAPYLVVYLYNPDCEHCQEQSPVLVNLYRKWQAQPQPEVDVYAIAVDTDDASWRNYVAKTGMSWTNVFDPTNRSIYRTYYVDITPEVYVVGPDRTIIAKNLNVDQIEEVIRRDKEKR